MENVKFTYLRDKTGNGRVLTLARMFDAENSLVMWGWAINTPTCTSEHCQDTHTSKKGDMFCRKVGRDIAVERLNNSCLVSVVGRSELPTKAILRFMAGYNSTVEPVNPLPTSVVRIAEQYKNEFNPTLKSRIKRLWRRLFAK